MRLLASSSALPNGGVPEFLIAEGWSQNQSKILIAVMYKPPRAGFLELFQEKLASFVKHYRFACILGDFNTNLQTVSSESTELIEMFSSQKLRIVPLEPTHHTRTSNTTIDVCAVSNLSSLTAWSQSKQPFLSRHDMMYISVKYNMLRNIQNICSYRPLKNIIMEDAFNFWSLHDNDTYNNQPNMDCKLSVFNSFLEDLLSEVAPIKTIIVNPVKAPWIDNNLRLLRRQRDSCYRASRRYGSNTLFEKYVYLRRKFKHKLSAAKNNYLQKKFEMAHNTRVFWKEIDNLGLTNKGSQVHHVPLISPMDLNRYFASVSSKNRLPSFKDCVFGEYCSLSGDVQFNLSEVNSTSVKKAISRVTTRASGLDGFSIEVNKVLQDILLPYILDICNNSILDCAYPAL